MIFSSTDLPAHLGDRARFNLWHEILNADIALAQFAMSEKLPFQIAFAAVRLGPLTCASAFGTVTGAARSAAQAASDDHYTLHINTSAAPMGGSYRKREIDLAVGGALLIASAEQSLLGHENNRWIDLRIPVGLLDAAFPGVEARQGHITDPRHEALRLLRHYIMLLDGDDVPTTPAVVDHMTATIVDLFGLAIGANGDEAALAKTRGLRRARLESVLAILGRDYAQPALSAELVGQSLGLSARYVQDLLATTGKSFSERVLDLRLDHAKKMLAARGLTAMRIGDI
ncbi:MAG: AraC family transcriptional regulator, partial [Alphaproteobacteria bacterium]